MIKLILLACSAIAFGFNLDPSTQRFQRERQTAADGGREVGNGADQNGRPNVDRELRRLGRVRTGLSTRYIEGHIYVQSAALNNMDAAVRDFVYRNSSFSVTDEAGEWIAVPEAVLHD